jgi:hypothetical protein
MGAASSAGEAVVVAGASVEPAQPHEGAAAAQLLQLLHELHELQVLQLLQQRLWQWLKQ